MSYIVVKKSGARGASFASLPAQKIIELDEEFNNQGYHPARLIDADKCTGCAMCAEMCPDVAIEVYKEVEK